jgi:hypothetical protein
MAWWFFGFFLLFLLPYHVEMIQCYHLLRYNAIISCMN